MDKRTVAEIISEIIAKTSDVFQIFSDEISISSDKISISSEKIGKSLRIRARFLGQMILNSRGVHSFLSSLLKILTKIRPAF